MTANKYTKFFTNLSVLITVGMLLIGMAWLVRGRETRELTEESKQAPIPVRIFTITSTKPTLPSTLTGIVEARYVTDLAFRVGGKIDQRLANVGNVVRSGAKLFQLDDNDYKLQVASAESELAVATAAMKRADADEQRQKSLLASRSISDDEYDNALSQRDIARGRRSVAQRALELARNRLSYSTLEAPAAGVILDVFAEQGQMVAEGQRVARLAHDGDRELVVNVPERWLGRLKSEEPTITYWSAPGVTSRANLRELSPSADPTTRTFVARFTILDLPADMQLGMTATLHLHESQPGESIALPSSALVGDSQKPSVWKVVDDSGQIVSVPVEVLKFARNEVIVKGALNEGDQIVSAGAHKLDPSVTVRKWEEMR
jgi:membrane fusion protein, multidrug efflux system